MSIKIGDKLPSVKLKRLTADGLQEVDTGELFSGKKVVLFTIPGAFTPTCSKTHLPGYVARADEIKAQGVDEIFCLTANDPFVTHAWGQQLDASGKVTLLPDGNGEFTKALGMEADLSVAGLGTRIKRFSLVAKDGVVESLKVEDDLRQVVVSGADTCLSGV